MNGVAAISIACEDLNADGKPELVVANYRKEFEYDTESFLYWGREDGFDTNSPLGLPTHYAAHVTLGDLNFDKCKEIIFCGGDRIYIYWNRDGHFHPDDRTVLEAQGNRSMFSEGFVHACVADVDGDGQCELLVATLGGVEIRAADNLDEVKQLLALKYCVRVEAVDLGGDGRLDVIASKYHDGRNYETESAIFWNGPHGFGNERVTWLATRGAVGCTAGDLDDDGKPEIIFNNTLGGPSQFNPDLPVYVYLGNAESRYSPDNRLELPSGGGTNTYVLADLDQDGYADLAFVSPEGLRIFHGGPDAPRPDQYSILHDRGHFFHYVLVGDFNKDGWLDLIGVGYTYDDKPQTMANSTVIFWGADSGFCDENATVLPTYCNGNATVADVNQDGWSDVIYFDNRGYLAVYLGGQVGYSEDRMWKVPFPPDAYGAICAITTADLTENGWLDLILSSMGHYTRKESGFFILYGGPGGYSADRMEFHRTDASSVMISLADLNNDGHLDWLVPAYSTQFKRELPALIYRGTETDFDFENPVMIPCDASCAFLAVDITGNGYRDLLTVCHRNDMGHQVDSLLFWNGPDGLCFEEPTRLPGLGPHLSSSRDFGNAYTREPLENYVSPARDTRGTKPLRISWTPDVPDKTQLQFQLRCAGTPEQLADARWLGPNGEESFYDSSGQRVDGIGSDAKWIQYKAIFVSPDGCRSPKLKEVRIDFNRSTSP